MSIPVQFDFLLKDGTFLNRKCIFTISYTDDQSNLSMLQTRLEETLASYRKTEDWVDEIDKIYPCHIIDYMFVVLPNNALQIMPVNVD